MLMQLFVTSPGQERSLTSVIHKAVAVHAWPVPTKDEEAIPHSSAGMAPAGARRRAYRAGVVKQRAAGDVTILNVLPPMQRQGVCLKALQPRVEGCCAASPGAAARAGQVLTA